MTAPENPNPQSGLKTGWKDRNPFAYGIACGSLVALGAVGIGAGAYLTVTQHHAPATIKAVEDKRLDLLRPLIATPTASTADNQPAAPQPPPEDLPAECQKFVSDLQALLDRATEHATALREAATSSYLANRSSEIDMDALTAKSNALKQDLADFQQTYPRIDPLISSLTPEQINQISDIKDQFGKYQRLSERFDNTLAGIDDYRDRLAGSEAYASVSATNPPPTDANDQTSADTVVSSTTTQTTTTVTSQPGSVYTDPVYYDTGYYTPTVSLWFGYSSYDPFWATSYYYPYWGYKNRYYPPPHPPGPPHNHDHGPKPPRPPGPPPGKPFPGNNPPWTQPSNPVRPKPDNQLPRPGSGSQPKPSLPTPPRNTITIPADDNNRPNPRNLPWQQSPSRPQNRPTTTDAVTPANNNTPAYVAPNRPGNATSPSPAPSSRPTPDSTRPSWQQQRPSHAYYRPYPSHIP
jgi:hypothetical protein